MAQPLELLETQYDIVAKLREGGMGEIYQVRHRLLDELRIAKVLRPQHQNDAEMSARFAQEARAAIRLRHPNIVQIFDFAVGESGDGLIVMEYIRGVDLHRLIHRRPLPSMSLALEIARQGLRALGYLHQNGFIHRDVSPDNVMLSLDYEGRPLVKLIDLGIAKNIDSPDDLTTSGTFLGKFRYASPEHFGPGGGETVDPRSDLYSFGLVFYELLTGRFPLDSESTSQLIAGHLYHPPHPFNETDPAGRVPDEVRALSLRLLAKSPPERFADAEAVISVLERIQSQYPLADEGVLEAQAQVTPSPAERAAAGSASSAVASSAATSDPEIDPAKAAPGSPQDSRTMVAALDYLLVAAREALGHGQLQSAEELLAGAREQVSPESTKSVLLEALEAEIEERREGQEEGLSRVTQEVEEFLARGELMAADRALFQAVEIYGDHPALGAVRKRLDRIHHRGFEEDVRGFIEQAEEMAARDDLNEALDLVVKAQALAPQESPLQAEVTALGERLETQAEERRQRWVDSTRKAIDERLSASDLQGARAALGAAEARLGAGAEAYELGQFFGGRVLAAVAERRAASQAAAAEGHFGEALTRLREALALSENDPEVREELEEAEANETRNEESLHHDEGWNHALRAIEEALDSDDLALAEERRRKVEECWGGGATLSRLEERIADLRQREIQRRLRDAEASRESNDLLAARLLLVQIFELDPQNREARRLSASLDQDTGAFEAASPEIETTVATIREIHANGQRLAAWRAVQEAVERYGEAAPLAQLRREIAAAMMGDDAEN